MSRHLAVIAMAYFAFANSANSKAEEIEPYTAYVSTRLADVRSGPQGSAYVTDRLGRGAEVEVYQRRDDGWLGIRPPADQYSLVRASEVELTEDASIAEVTLKNAKAWVGTDFADRVHLKSYVALERGEFVEILGSRRAALTADGPEEKLYEIAPPAGEFRWIRISDVRRRRPRPEAADLEFADLQQLPKQSPPAAQELSRENESTVSPAESQSSSQTRWRSRTSVRSRDATTRTAEVPEVPAGSLNKPAGSLNKIHAEIAAAVSGAPSQWNLAPLRRRCETLLKTSPSTIERGQAKLALQRIEEFENLRRRKLAIRGPGSQVQVASATTPAVGTLNLPFTKTPITANNDGVLPEYDGYGILKPVHSTKRPAPPFALVNEEGKILKFVTPAPGMNLRRYVNEQVGIIGQRGVVADLNMDHVTAERIIELKRHRR